MSCPEEAHSSCHKPREARAERRPGGAEPPPTPGRGHATAKKGLTGALMAVLWLGSSAPAAAQTPPPTPPRTAPAEAKAARVTTQEIECPAPTPSQETGAEVAGKNDPQQAATKAEDDPVLALGHMLIGVQLAGTVAPGKPSLGLGASALSWTEIFEGTEEKNLHLETFFSLGGGSAGFEGALQGKRLWGALFRSGAHNGLAARIGFHGWIWGNNQLYSSLLSVPEGELGWQFARGRFLFEAGVHGGAVLVGRYRPGVEESRKLGRSVDYGAYASIITEQTQVSLEMTRVDSLPWNSDEKPVDDLHGTLCLIPIPVALCLRGDWLHGRSPAASPRVHDSFYAGLVIGLPLLGPLPSGKLAR